MGVDIHGYYFLKYVKEKYGNYGQTIQLGRQKLYLTEKFKNKNGIGSIRYLDLASDSLFGTSVVHSMDYSNYEGASVVHDLNFPVTKDLIHKYDTIIDLGTTEHVFNTAQVLDNCDKMIKFGGKIIHVLPANNFNGHGFYQFSPELFFSYYSELNGYNSEVFLVNLSKRRYWYKIKSLSDGKRLEVNHHGPMYVMVVATKINTNKSRILQSDYKFVWAHAKETDMQKIKVEQKIEFPITKSKIIKLIVVLDRFNIMRKIYYVFNKRNLEKFYFNKR